MNTNLIVLTWSGARPDDLAPILVGESRRLRFGCAPVAGDGTLTDFALESWPPGLDCGAPLIADREATVLVTAGQGGCFALVATATLSSGEIVKGLVRVSVAPSDPAAPQG